MATVLNGFDVSPSSYHKWYEEEKYWQEIAPSRRSQVHMRQCLFFIVSAHRMAHDSRMGTGSDGTFYFFSVGTSIVNFGLTSQMIIPVIVSFVPCITSNRCNLECECFINYYWEVFMCLLLMQVGCGFFVWPYSLSTSIMLSSRELWSYLFCQSLFCHHINP